MSATILRFEYPATYTVSPATLRFLGTTPPDEPQPLEVWADLGWLALSADLNHLLDLDIGTAVSFEHNVDLMETGYPSLDIEHDFSWSSFEVVQLTTDLAYTSTVATDATCELVWSLQYATTAELDLTWHIGGRIYSQLDVVWQVNQNLNDYVTDLTWFRPKAEDQLIDAVWQVNQLIRNSEFATVWGPHPGGWVCSTDARLIKGKATLRFNVPGGAAGGVISLRFVESPEYCYWDDGGGPINLTPDLPNFDFDVTIEPQIRRVYLMQPTLSVIRVSDLIPIIVTGVSISSARGSFTQSGTIEFASRGDCDRAMNQLLLVTINGYEFYAIPEEKSHRQSFNSTQYSASFRSRTAQLAEPWRLPISYSNAVNRSLAGIMGDILQNTGWTVELVGFTDFNVPAKVFSISGKGPIESVNEIADMIGCMVVEDEADSILRIIPYWPVTPWTIDTAVPAVAIHEAVIESYSAGDEISEQCNAAWVRGEQQGVSRQVKLTGTAGNIPTTDISNKLIVSDTPARLAGTKAIADTGPKEKISVTMPVMNDLPPLVKGMVVGVSYFGEIYKAICDSVTISATVGSDGIDVTQTATLVRHRGDFDA